MASVRLTSGVGGTRMVVALVVALVATLLPVGWSGAVVTAGSDGGPDVVHVPVATTFHGRALPIEATVTCDAGAVCGGRLLYRPTSEGQTSDTGWTVADLTVVSDTALADGDRAVELAGTVPAAVVTTTGIDYYLEATQDQRVTFVPTSVEASAGGVTVADGQAWYHVVTVAPPLVVHEPPSVTFAGRDRDLRLSASCSTGSCTATVFWRVSEAGVVDEPLTEVPNWNSMSMEPTATTGVGDPGAWVDYEAVVPAADVTTDGLDYVFAVGDGHTTTWWPGTMWEGHVSARDGMRTGYVRLSVLEPPHLVHVPVASSPYGEPIDIRATTNCPTATGAGTGLTGGVNGDGDRYGSYQGGSLSGSRYTAVTATATVGTVGAVDVPVLEVAHTFSESPDPRLKQIEVTITNTSPYAAADVRYRRAIEYEVEPTPHEQFVTLLERTGPLPELLYSSNDGFAVPDPLAGPSDLGVTGTFTDYGPGNFGYLIDLGLGQLAPGGVVSFTLLVGAAVSETSALAAIDDIAADLYGLSQSNTPNGPSDGTPVTFIFGYRR